MAFLVFNRKYILLKLILLPYPYKIMVIGPLIIIRLKIHAVTMKIHDLDPVRIIFPLLATFLF